MPLTRSERAAQIDQAVRRAIVSEGIHYQGPTRMRKFLRRVVGDERLGQSRKDARDNFLLAIREHLQR